MALDLNISPNEDEEDAPFGGLPHGQDQRLHTSMALDLNIPPTEDEPFGGLPHGQDHPPLAGAHPMGDACGAPSFDINTAAYESVDEMDWFSAPTAPSHFDLNFEMDEEEADEDANVYANDFHVIFADQGTCNE
ncbi:unnamed protein product [Urochloa humidicola]